MPKAPTPPPLNISGILPSIQLVADLGPPRSEAGTGALMSWAGRLWAVTYCSSGGRSGRGTGLYEIDENFKLTRRPESVVGTYANRMVHFETNQLIIGPHLIDAQRNVRTFDDLAGYRLAATTRHLTDPANKVYFLGMEGHLFEADLRTLKARQIADLVAELDVERQAQQHFKAAYAGRGRLIVANNTYEEPEFLGERAAGRLAEWDGKTWTVLERNPFNEVWGRQRMGAVFATGWDRASAIMRTYTPSSGWTRYRLPKASHVFDHFWATEWPRVREIEHERYLMDCHGMFYEMSLHAYGGRVWGVRPISTHLWAVPDSAFRGLLVLGFNQNTASQDDNTLVGEPHAGLWLGKLEDLWSFGRPAGWGGPWWDTPLEANQPSDPYLMTGFKDKCLHLAHQESRDVQFTLQVDFRGHGRWNDYATFTVGPRGYVHHEFPPGFSAHWARLIADRACLATAQFAYT